MSLLHIHKMRDLPDAGEGMCCIGAAVHGAGGCTCWNEQHDLPQARPLQAGPVAIRKRMCADCAFRADSPERNGDARFANSAEGDLDLMAMQGGVSFYCHQGMRRVLETVHPSGVSVPAGPGHYDPPIVGGHAFKANGCPADVCAGFANAKGMR